MKAWGLGVVLLVLVVLAGGGPALASGEGGGALPAESVMIDTAFGPVEFDLEIADTMATRMRGLMFRTSLPERGGMLFDFGRPQVVQMWMRNTLIPLDMLFVDGRGRIVHIEHDAVPHDETPRGPAVPVPVVIELAGGTAAALGITEGAQVRHRLFDR